MDAQQDRRVAAGYWSSTVLVLTVGILIFLLISGLVIYFAPLPSNFTESQTWGWTAVQWMVLIHTVLGLLSVVVYGWYQWRHYFAMRPVRLNRGKLLGALSFWVFVVSGVTGLILTWEAFFGPSITYWIDVVHTWGSLLMVPLLGWHLVRAWLRHRKWFGQEMGGMLRGAQRRLVWGSSGVALLLLLVGVILALAIGGPDLSAGIPPQTYNLKYGNDPFMPSNVDTSTGQPINADLMAGSENCGTCHKDIYEEWNASAHRWSTSDVFYKTVASAMENDTGSSPRGTAAGVITRYPYSRAT